MTRKQTESKEVKALRKNIANGHSVETMVKWWIRLAGPHAEVKDGTVSFYASESVSTGHGCYRHTGKSFVAVSLATW